ncbi:MULTISPECIES: DUF1634 domain-containing protein [Acidithrix]|uniref:DUF1634 domain-containing protein n=1 Tax=Acidithrix ferrooxidans TaxID=1280514 RepID=A0A0D8HKI1_9ACTN|nr:MULTISPECIES: DUF1634 domain-containing protein [Acidithrix]KJF18364.1 hypothetical protein AXFE_07520 [Acidithrix ferrooxidans]CAG4920813.1 unnamed protein product [Acidithrix sp. C25]
MRLTRRPPETEEQAKVMNEKIRMTEITISLVLRIGVALSVAIFIVGLVVMFAHHPAYAKLSGSLSFHSLTSPSSQFPHSFSGLWNSLAKGQGRGIIVLGTMVLIITPVLRVAVAIVSFSIEKDPAMTIVTIYVFAVLILSFFLAGA